MDLVDTGIINPTKVVRLALENALSVAGVLLLTEATMTEGPDAKPEMAAAGSDGHQSAGALPNKRPEGLEWA